jgi:hypothetical protein
MVMVPEKPAAPGSVAVFKRNRPLVARLKVLLPARLPSGLQKCGLQPAVNYGAGGRPAAAPIGDFSGDERQDLAVANYDSGTVSYGTADGTAISETGYQAASGDLTLAPGAVTASLTVLVLRPR